MIPQALTFLDRVKVAASSTRDFSRMAEWLCQYTRSPRDNRKPWSFKDHEMQIAIANETRHHVIVRKCSQVGLSELSVRISLGTLNLYPGSTAIYTLPTAKFAGKFAKTRIDPVIQAAPVLKSSVPTGNDSSELKQLGTSFLYIVGTSGSTSPISIPADMLIRDEVDFSNQAILSTFFSRLGHAEEGGWIRDFSTPTVDGFGISADFEKSTMMRYLIKCYVCGQWSWPTILEDVIIPGFNQPIVELTQDDLENRTYKIDEAYLSCPACSGELTQANLADTACREWVAEQPDSDIAGYQVVPFDVPRYNPIPKTLRAVKQYTNKADWVNFETGVPYQDAENSFLLSTVQENTVVSPVLPRPNAAHGCLAGLDIGKTSWFMVGYPVSEKRIDLLYAEQIQQNEDNHLVNRTLELLKYYGVAKMVVDAGPDFTAVVQIMAKALVGQVYGCYYVRSASTALSNIDVDEVENIVKASKAGTFDITAKKVNSGYIKFPRMESEKHTIQSHLGNMARVSRIDTQGERIASWVGRGPDHYANALNYLVIAGSICDYLNIHSLIPAPVTFKAARFGVEMPETGESLLKRMVHG